MTTEPVIRVGTRIELSGHAVKVQQVTRNGVVVTINNTNVTVPFEQVMQSLKTK